MHKCIYLVPTAVIKVMVGRNPSDDPNTRFLCGSLDLGHIVRVDRSGGIGGVVDEEICVVVFPDGDGDDLHLGGGGGGKGSNRQTDRN